MHVIPMKNELCLHGLQMSIYEKDSEKYVRTCEGTGQHARDPSTN